MKKINKIDSCIHCPLHYSESNGDKVCLHIETEGREIINFNTIPEWCPMPEDI